MDKYKWLKGTIALTAVLILLLSSCSKSVYDYLSTAAYEDAYNVAATDDEKTMIKAENTIAYLCSQAKKDCFADKDVEFRLQSARYIDGGEKMNEAFAGLYYYLLEISINDTTEKTPAYILYSYSTKEDELWNIFNALDLETNDADDTSTAFWKEAVSLIIQGDIATYKLEPESVYRINELIAEDLIDGIALADDMRLN